MHVWLKIKDFHRETEIKYDYLSSKRGKKRKRLSSKFVKPLIINATEVIFKIVSHKTSEDQETIWPLNSNEWPRQIFSSKYQCNIIQTCKWWEQRSNQLGDYWLIQNQILRTKIISIVWQTGRRITNEILGVKGLTGACSCGEPVQLLFLLLKRCKKSRGSLETN